MRPLTILVLLTVGLGLTSTARLAAQDRPFIFSVATAKPSSEQRVRVDFETGAGERAFASDTANRPEQRIGVQVSSGRITVLARVGLSSVGSAYESSQSGELLVSLLDRGASRVALAAGGGVLHEAGGVNVLLGRVVAMREVPAWRAHANLLLQKPLAADRDAVDLATSAGWARRVTPAVALGVEFVGEDLEGFWEPSEAEGGARLLLGPSLHVMPRGRRWQLTAAGGPTLHPAANPRSSDALRDLPPTARRWGYAARASLSIAVF